MAFTRESKTGLTTEDLKRTELYGVVLKARGEAEPLSDEVIRQKLWAAEDFYESDLSLLWQPTRIFSDPQGRANSPDIALRVTDYNETKDLAEAPYPYSQGHWDHERWGLLKLLHGPIRAINTFAFIWPGGQRIWSPPRQPVDWLNINYRWRTVQITPGSGVAVMMTFAAYMLSVVAGGRGLPQSIVVDYTAGFTPDVLQARYQHLLEGVRLRTLLQLGGILSTIPSGGQTSFSLGLDGLSHGRSFGGRYGAYSGLLTNAVERETEIRQTFRDKDRGVRMAILG